MKLSLNDSTFLFYVLNLVVVCTSYFHIAYVGSWSWGCFAAVGVLAGVVAAVLFYFMCCFCFCFVLVFDIGRW